MKVRVSSRPSVRATSSQRQAPLRSTAASRPAKANMRSASLSQYYKSPAFSSWKAATQRRTYAEPAAPAAPAADAVKEAPVKYEKRGNVGLITLNRTKFLNSLNDDLFQHLYSTLSAGEKDADIGAFVITGSKKAFAAGADIKEMSTRTYIDTFARNMFSEWEKITREIRKPIIAAVNGYALGGGCELALACDIIIAGDKAQFGQPEIKLGTIPGIGGSQRLTRAIGKTKSMELILTGDLIDAATAEKWGLVSRVVPEDQTVETALALAKKIASYSKPIVAMAKAAVNAADDLSLKEGLIFERNLFHASFATADRKEGMDAFLSKREPNWTHQ